jgi:hypothetical protein
MDPVNPLHPAFAALRQQLAENIERLRKSGRVAVRAGSPSPAPAQAPSLHAAVAARVAGIDRRSAQGRERATRALVEVALLAEFGEELLSDPAFGAMLDEISSNLREDADIRVELDALIEGL